MGGRPSGRGGRPDATGRSSGKNSSKGQKIFGPPKGEPWVWLLCELMAGLAWRARSRTAVRIVDYLMVEHRNHAGRENGNLCATYDSLVRFGCSRKSISEAIAELQLLGLIDVDPGGRWHGSNHPSRYRLTFYADRHGNPPTDEWKRVTKDDITRWRAGRRKQKQRSQRGTTVMPALGTIEPANSVRGPPNTVGNTAISGTPRSAHIGNCLYISVEEG